MTTQEHTHDSAMSGEVKEKWEVELFDKFHSKGCEERDEYNCSCHLADIEEFIRTQRSIAQQEILDRLNEQITEYVERIVIDYANLSGRESANRATFREKTREHFQQFLLTLTKDI